MPDTPDFNAQTAHKYFSTTCFNRAWDYIDKIDRSKEDNLDMLLSVLASLWHWKQRLDATATNLSVGYWQAARVYTLIGQVDNARRFGLLSLEESLKEDVPPFYKGYAYEALAMTEALAGDREQMEFHLKLAHEASEEITDQEEKKILLDDLASIG